MVKQIFVNLPVADLKASIAFFTRLGFSFNPDFTDDTATCMIVGERIYAMLLARERFAGFAPHPPADARAATEVLLALQLDSRAAVDAMVKEGWPPAATPTMRRRITASCTSTVSRTGTDTSGRCSR